VNPGAVAASLALFAPASPASSKPPNENDGIEGFGPPPDFLGAGVALPAPNFDVPGVLGGVMTDASNDDDADGAFLGGVPTTFSLFALAPPTVAP